MSTGTPRQAVVIGSGFAGLSAATHLAHKASNSCSVIVLEKNAEPGGRARKFQAEGFTFDMGPSWYWMPDVLENYFAEFGKKPSDYYELVRLDPSYKVVFDTGVIDVPADLGEFRKMCESIEPGSAEKLDQFLEEAKYNYEYSMGELVYCPNLSISEYASWKTICSLFRMKLFSALSKQVRKLFKSEKLVRLFEFPVLFLGETAENIPAAFSLMNYADIVLGTWYPMGGMFKMVEALVDLAQEKGVKFRYSAEVESIDVSENQVRRIRLKGGEVIEADLVVAGADYHHVDKDLLNPYYSNYDEEYWDSRVLAPSSLLFYLGVNKKLKNLRHHNLFFDEPLEPHADAIYSNPRWPDKPLFYLCVPSITDPMVAPEGMENLFILIPLAPGLEDTETFREKYYNIVMDRLEARTHQEIRSHVIYKRSYAHNDFQSDYHAYKGNAYGLANTLFQSAFFKPAIKNKHVHNLYYAGQLTVPGPGIAPSLISGSLAVEEAIKDHNLH